MIPAGVQVFVAVDPIDMRSGFERLSGLCLERTGYSARSRALFVFMGKRRQSLKILFFDGTGMCLFHKRLDRGVFQALCSVTEGATSVEIDDARLEVLLDGIDIQVTQVATKPKRARPPRVH